MSNAYLIGHLTVKDAEKWEIYRSLVPATLAPWGAELVLRGKRTVILAGEIRTPMWSSSAFPIRRRSTAGTRQLPTRR